MGGSCPPFDPREAPRSGRLRGRATPSPSRCHGGGEGIELRGFGTFKVRRRKPRTARNPRTGEPVEVPLRRAPVFNASRLLRDRVNRR
ncbi:HU family DNA-binding protein [Candidatus Palauibacter sp.]|uniref:HU family DNA-binding protein n=1 Tax=Candidatus Palauibacter sp. TaxID=3101350 RepID=UPI003B5ADF4C